MYHLVMIVLPNYANVKVHSRVTRVAKFRIICSYTIFRRLIKFVRVEAIEMLVELNA